MKGCAGFRKSTFTNAKIIVTNAKIIVKMLTIVGDRISRSSDCSPDPGTGKSAS
jgi:hypothetical protein